MLRKLEKYEIEEEIGHGGMATVYRAHDTVLDRAVALKVMHPHLRGAEEARRRFHREAQSVARLRHPRVLEIYDFSGEGSAEAYIAAELLTGPTLKQWREDRREGVPAEIAACFVIEIAKALEAAHGAKIVHRDVKPENVLLHENRTLKLTDFGIADMVDAQSMTATGQILGSPGHMAPEQIEGKDTDARSDLFSLGTVLYYLATGRLPFTGRNPHQVLKRIMDAEFADPLRVNPTIGGRLRAIIIKSLELQPENRYQSARELREALEAFVAEVGISDPEQTLAAYLGDPETVAAALKKETIDRLIERGQRASDAGDVPNALDCYNRVLALDDGNQRVLKLIERVGMDKRRRAMIQGGAGLIALGLAAGGVAWFVATRPPEPEDPRPVPIAADVADDAGAAIVVAAADDAGPAAALDAAVQIAEATPDAGREPLVVRPVAVERAGPEQRMVQLSPPFPNVTVAIDGGEPHRILGPVALSVGSHDVVVAPGDDELGAEWQTARLRVRIPAGDDEYRLVLPMEPHDVRLLVHTNARDATVTASAGRGTRTGIPEDMVYVPLRQSPVTATVTVSAPGYQSRTERFQVQGGETAERTINLEREGERAQAP